MLQLTVSQSVMMLSPTWDSWQDFKCSKPDSFSVKSRVTFYLTRERVCLSRVLVSAEKSNVKTDGQSVCHDVEPRLGLMTKF